MRMYQLALFTFLFVLSLSIVSESGMFSNYGVGIKSVQIHNQDAVDFSSGFVQESGKVVTTTGESGVSSDPNFSWYNAIYQFIFVGIPKFIEIIFYTTIGIPILLQGLFIPSGLAWLISGAVWFIYTAGMLQFYMDRDVKKYE
jgi:hypothetical protein